MLPRFGRDQFIPTRARLCGGDLGLVHPKDRDFAAMARHAAAPDLLARVAQRTASQALVMSGEARDQRSIIRSTRRSATLASSEPLCPITTCRSFPGSTPSLTSSSATTWLRVIARYRLASCDPVALALASMRTAFASRAR